MNLTVLQDTFRKALAVVMPAVASKSTLPVLSHVQLTADDSGMWLAASNLEVGIRTHIGAKVEQHGGVCLPFKLLSDLIGGLPNTPIDLELDERTQTVTVKAGKFKADIKGLESDEFPVMVTSGDPLFSMPDSDWALVAEKVAICASGSIAQPVLCGVHIFSKDGVTFEAADSYRLARKRFNHDVGAIDTIIPAESLTMARSVFAGADSVLLSTANGGALVVFESESATLTSRVIDGKYPDVDCIIPSTYTSRLVVPAADLASRVKLAKFVAVSSSNIVRLDLTTAPDMDGKLGIGANAAEVADLSDAMDVIATGKDTTIALNVKYLADAVAACGAGDIAIELQSSTHPAVLRSVGDDSYTHIIMAMTVR